MSAVSVGAETSGDYTYTVSNGKATITKCSTSISGDITIPSELGGCPVTSIGRKAFYNCESLTSINVDESNSNYCDIDGILFNKDKTELIQYPAGKTATSYTIPDSVTSIGSSAFYNCTKLTSIIIPNSVTSIGDLAFYGNTSLTDVYYKGSEEDWNTISIGSNNTAFDTATIHYDYNEYSKYFTYTVSNEEAIITKFDTSINGDITIPSKLGGYPVTSIGSSAFYKCENLTSITISNMVTSISDFAFYNCTKLTSITIPDSVTSIGDLAFYGNTSLTDVYYKGSEEDWNTISIGSNNTALDNATIHYDYKEYFKYFTYTVSHEKVTITGFNTSFSGDITIPNKLGGYAVTSIGSRAFSNCKSLKSVTIPDSVTSIGSRAFFICASLKSVTISNSVTSIDGYTFYNCKSLTSITIPNSVTRIGDYAFYGCESLTSITIPDSVTSIGNTAFWGCTSLTSITIPDSVTSIGSGAFNWCTKLTSIQVDENNINYCDIDGVLFNKDKTELIQYPVGNTATSYIIQDGVTSIGDDAFRVCKSLTSITIPNSVTRIGSQAFYNTGYYNNKDNWDNNVLYIGNYLIEAKTGISGEYTIKEGTKVIADSAFSWCESLTSITIPDSVICIDGYTFYDCKSLTSITIPDSVTSIGKYAFLGCKSLTSITIPNSVTSIGYGAFDSCTSLTSVTIPDSVTRIGDNAFDSCKSLTSVTIPDSVTSIGSSAFYNTGYYNNADNWEDNVLYIGNYLIDAKTSISGEYTVKEGTKVIGDSAFENCTSLKSITIPNSVTSIGIRAFSNCTSLTSINVDENNSNYCDIDGVLFNKNKTILIQYPIGNKETSYKIPNSVTSIGNYAFRWCTSLTSVTIGNGVTSIDNYAFSNCTSLTSVTIPNSVTSIGNYAFYYCSSDLTIYGYANTKAEEYAKNNNINFVAFSHTHSYTAEITKQPTCTEKGVKTYTCLCGESYTEEVPAFGHTEAVDKSVAPTCTETGLTEGKHCSVCDEVLVKQEVVPALGHTEAVDKSVAPTCTEKGLTEGKHCSVCGEVIVKQEVVPAKGHDYKEDIFKYQVATCTEPGYKVYVCSRCGDESKVADVPAQGHKVECVETKNATCTDDGFKIYKCSLCDYSVKEVIKAVGKHTEVVDKVVSPTCTETGLTDGKHCSVCGEVIVKQEVVPALGHKEVIDKAVTPTCTKTGLTEGKHCSVCGEILVKQKSIPAKVHSYKCVVTKKASYVSNGLKSYKCSVCGKVAKTASIAKLKLKTPSFSVSAGKKLFKVKYTKVTGATGFQVKYTIGKKTVTKTFNTAKSVTKTISGLKKVSYKVQIRAFVKQGSKTAYSDWTKAKSVKVK